MLSGSFQLLLKEGIFLSWNRMSSSGIVLWSYKYFIVIDIRSEAPSRGETRSTGVGELGSQMTFFCSGLERVNVESSAGWDWTTWSLLNVVHPRAALQSLLAINAFHELTKLSVKPRITIATILEKMGRRVLQLELFSGPRTIIQWSRFYSSADYQVNLFFDDIAVCIRICSGFTEFHANRMSASACVFKQAKRWYLAASTNISRSGARHSRSHRCASSLSSLIQINNLPVWVLIAFCSTHG